MNELIPSQGILTKTAWQLPENLSEADWTKAGHALARIEGSISWWLGDWWAYGHTYGERKALVESEEWEGPTFQACMNAACVCRSFETSRRREVLSFNHHREVLPIEDPQVQDRFLDWCEEGVSLNGGKPRSTRELRRAVREYIAGTVVPRRRTYPSDDSRALRTLPFMTIFGSVYFPTSRKDAVWAGRG